MELPVCRICGSEPMVDNEYDEALVTHRVEGCFLSSLPWITFEQWRTLMGAPEPVAEIIQNVIGVEIGFIHPKQAELPVGTKLYTHPWAYHLVRGRQHED